TVKTAAPRRTPRTSGTARRSSPAKRRGRLPRWVAAQRCSETNLPGAGRAVAPAVRYFLSPRANPPRGPIIVFTLPAPPRFTEILSPPWHFFCGGRDSVWNERHGPRPAVRNRRHDPRIAAIIVCNVRRPADRR